MLKLKARSSRVKLVSLGADSPTLCASLADEEAAPASDPKLYLTKVPASKKPPMSGKLVRVTAEINNGS